MGKHLNFSDKMNKLKKQRFKRNLVAVLALYLSVFFAFLILLGGLYLLYVREILTQSRIAQLQNQVLEQALAAELAETTGHIGDAPAFSAEFLALCDQIWIENAQGTVTYASDMGALRPMLSTYKNNIRFGGERSGVLVFARSRSQLFYRYRLHSGASLYCVVPAAALDISHAPFYVFLGFVALGGGALLTILLLFRRNIYKPIVSIEYAVDFAMEGDVNFDLSVPAGNELYPLSQKVNSMLGQMREILIREYNSKILRKQSEINALQSQINPHFLYNTLDSIRGQALMQGSFEIANLLKSLSSIFRYSISKTSSLMPLRDEFSHMDNYLTIQQYRFNNKFDVIKSFDGDEDELLSYQVPKLTIQPIVENSVFHGLETKKGKGRINIHVYSTEKRLIIEIEDNGIGIEDEKLKELNRSMCDEVGLEASSGESGEGNSIALKNVNQRIRLLYGPSFGVKVYSTLGIGTMVQMVLPLIRE